MVPEVSAIAWRAINCLSCMFNKQLGWQPGPLDSHEFLKWSSVWLTLSYLQANGMVWLSEGGDGGALTLWHFHFWLSFFQASLFHISFFRLLPFFWRKALLLLLMVFSIKLTSCYFISLPAKGELIITVLGISPAVSYQPQSCSCWKDFKHLLNPFPSALGIIL